MLLHSGIIPGFNEAPIHESGKDSIGCGVIDADGLQ